eukprot:322118-Pelagomonas_calceolata.AAC.1
MLLLKRPTFAAGQASWGELPEDPILAGIWPAFWSHPGTPPQHKLRARTQTCTADLTFGETLASLLLRGPVQYARSPSSVRSLFFPSGDQLRKSSSFT